MAKLKKSTYFPHIFSKFSSNFLQLFQMTKLDCFHHRSTNVCKNTVKVKAAFCSNEFLLCQECVIFWLHGFCVNQPCTWCGNVLETSHIWHLVCVCVLGWISQPYVVLRPVSGIWAYQSTKDEMPQQDRFLWMTPLNSCKNNGWDGETKLSSRAPPRPQTASLKTRGKLKEEEVESVKPKKWLYKIQPLRQQKAIAIWPSASEHGYSIHEAKRHSLDFTLRRALWSTAFQRSLFILIVPSSILQREGFWQHKGLEKHNTISVASSILTCNGLATLKGSPPGCKYRSHLDRKGLCWAFPSWWPHSAKQRQSHKSVGWHSAFFNVHHSAFFTTNSSVEQVDWPHSHTPTNHELIAHVADKETLLINCHCTLKGKTEKPWGKTHLLQLIDVSSCSDDFECIPSKLETTSSVLRQQPSKLNPCPIVCYVLVLTKEQGKETWALPIKNLWRLLTTIWQRKDVGRPFFKTLRNYQPLCVHPETPEQHKECVNQQNTVYHKFCPRFLSCSFEGTSH